MEATAANAMDHVVVVLFENRSFDNVLGRLYDPSQRPGFDGVLGKELSNPVPVWAADRPADGVVRYDVADHMDSPNPDPGEEFQHTNTQLYNVLDPANRFKDATDMVGANEPAPGQLPTMDGFVTDYISFFAAQMGRQPDLAEYRQIMTGFTPGQVPVLSALARGFALFDHWFSEVPSQTMANRAFWTAATSAGLVVNRPVTRFMHHNLAETIFERLERHGRTWKVYVLEPDPISLTAIIHWSRLKHRFATHFVPFSEFERDVAAGTLPNLSLVEPNLLAGHCDYHPAFGRALFVDVDVLVDPPSSVLGGEAFLARVYRALRAASAPAGSNATNTTLVVGWDEPGGTYDHVPPGRAAPPNPTAPRGQLGFRFDRSGYRVPAVVVSPWVDEGVVVGEEHRHTSLIATLRRVWRLGDPLSLRDAAAAPFDHLFNRTEPRRPDSWPDVEPQPVPAAQVDAASAGCALSAIGWHLSHGLRHHARRVDLAVPMAPPDPDVVVSPRAALDIVRWVGRHYFPALAP